MYSITGVLKMSVLVGVLLAGKAQIHRGEAGVGLKTFRDLKEQRIAHSTPP